MEDKDPAPGFSSSFFRATPSVNPVQTDIASLARGTLNDLYKQLKKSSKRAGDKMSRYHLEDCMMRIKTKLELEK
jgi:hypothetical protein